jgi:tryptophan synthase alpha chain
MSRLSDSFGKCRTDGKAALMPYLMAGYPTPDRFVDLMATVSRAGCDIVEVGIPFSDPLADGPTIQRVSQKALKQGVSVANTLALLSRIPNGERPPVVLMSYFNPLMQYGLDRFLADARAAGVAGLIVPDLVFEESDDLRNACVSHDIDLVLLLAPTSSDHRTAQILKRSQGFVYLVTVAGVTGARDSLPDSVSNWIADMRSRSERPVAAGFGISTAEQARTAARVADGVIVGSALLNTVTGTDHWSQEKRAFTRLLESLREATQNPNHTKLQMKGNRP